MRGLLAATAVAGVLAVGGLPTLGLTLAGDETGPEPAVTLAPPDERPDGEKAQEQAARKAERDRLKAQKERLKAEWRASGKADDPDAGPPPWAASRGDHVPPGADRRHQGRSPHGHAVRTWAHCVAEAARGLEPGERLEDASAHCVKPVPPGHAKAGKDGKAGKAGKAGGGPGKDLPRQKPRTDRDAG